MENAGKINYHTEDIMKVNSRKIEKSSNDKRAELRLTGSANQLHLLLDKQKFHIEISIVDSDSIKTLRLGIRDISIFYEFLRNQKEEVSEMFSGKTTTETELFEREDYLYYKRRSKGGTMVNTPTSRIEAEGRWYNKRKIITKIEIVEDTGWYIKFNINIKKSVIPFTVYIIGICGNHSKKITVVSQRLTIALQNLINKDQFYKKSMGIIELLPGDVVIGRGDIMDTDFDLVGSRWEDESKEEMRRALNDIRSDYAGCGI